MGNKNNTKTINNKYRVINNDTSHDLDQPQANCIITETDVKTEDDYINLNNFMSMDKIQVFKVYYKIQKLKELETFIINLGPSFIFDNEDTAVISYCVRYLSFEFVKYLINIGFDINKVHYQILEHHRENFEKLVSQTPLLMHFYSWIHVLTININDILKQCYYITVIPDLSYRLKFHKVMMSHLCKSNQIMSFLDDNFFVDNMLNNHTSDRIAVNAMFMAIIYIRDLDDLAKVLACFDKAILKLFVSDKAVMEDCFSKCNNLVKVLALPYFNKAILKRLNRNEGAVKFWFKQCDNPNVLIDIIKLYEKKHIPMNFDSVLGGLNSNNKLKNLEKADIRKYIYISSNGYIDESASARLKI